MYSNIDVQQQCFYGYDLSRRWYKIDWAVTHDAQVQGARYRCNLVPSWGTLDTEVGTSFGPANMRQQSFGSDARFSYPHNAAVDEMTGFLYHSSRSS